MDSRNGPAPAPRPGVATPAPRPGTIYTAAPPSRREIPALLKRESALRPSQGHVSTTWADRRGSLATGTAVHSSLESVRRPGRLSGVPYATLPPCFLSTSLHHRYQVDFPVRRDRPGDALLGQLQTVSRVASTRSAIQALSGVQLSASTDLCELRATDMDVGLRVPLEAEIRRDVVVVLPARLLLDVIRSLPAPTATLELRAAEQDVAITSGNATFHIRTLRADDFPPFPEPDPDTAISLPTEAFVATALKVARSASRDETRPVLTLRASSSGANARRDRFAARGVSLPARKPFRSLVAQRVATPADR